MALSRFTPENARIMAAKGHASKLARKANCVAALAISHLDSNPNGKDLTKAEPDTIARELETRSIQLQAIASRDLLDKAVVLHQRNPVNGKDLSQHLQSALTLVNAGDKLFGWSRNDAPRCLVQNNYLAELRQPAPQPVVSCALPSVPALDITIEQTAQTEAKP